MSKGMVHAPETCPDGRPYAAAQKLGMSTCSVTLAQLLAPYSSGMTMSGYQAAELCMLSNVSLASLGGRCRLVGPIPEWHLEWSSSVGNSSLLLNTSCLAEE